MKKIILIHNIINPTRTHLFNELDSFLKNRGYELKVLFLSATDKNRNWETEKDFSFKFDILKNWALRLNGKDVHTFFINTSILRYLRKENPDKIICFGWDHFAAHAANHWARKNKKDFIFYAESTAYEKSWRRTLSKPLVGHFLKNVTVFWAGGSRAKEYLESFGIEESKIQMLYNTVDIGYFEKKSAAFSDEQKNALKSKLRISTSKTILFNGQLIERKGIFELLEGFKSYQEKDDDISLLILGKGKEKEKMDGIIKEKGIKNVIFADFVQYDEVYKYYAISDLLILPSREEVWGLVINEAMACGLPIITTQETGAGADLVVEGKNGYIVESNCPNCITESIEKVFANNLHKDNSSKEIVDKTDVVKMLSGLKL